MLIAECMFYCAYANIQPQYLDVPGTWVSGVWVSTVPGNHLVGDLVRPLPHLQELHLQS